MPSGNGVPSSHSAKPETTKLRGAGASGAWSEVVSRPACAAPIGAV